MAETPFDSPATPGGPDASPEPRRWPRFVPRSLRVRTTAVASIAVGITLVVCAIALVVTLNSSMTRQVRIAADVRAEEIETALEAGRSPAEVVAGDADDEVVQILGVNGGVLAASEDLERAGPIADLAPDGHATIPDPTTEDDDDDDDGDGHDFVVVAEDADTDRGELTILVGRSTGLVRASTAFLVPALVVGVPVLTGLVGLVTWWIVGRTLAPVEAIRREVDEISATELHRRVPDPGSRDEIARLAATMNDMLARLQDARARQQRFISDASHELRSPVATIRHQAEVALSHPGTTTTDDLANVVLTEDLRLQQLVEDLLFLARSDEGTGPVRFRPVDLDDLVLDEVRHLRGTGITHLDATGVGAARVTGDPVRLARMLRNLGDNARRHARSTIRVGLTTTVDGWAVCTVEDDGAGVPVGERDRIFERFVRSDEARSRDHGGSGLGLAIVADIVATHGGSVRVDDSDLGGARFTVRLPTIPEVGAF